MDTNNIDNREFTNFVHKNLALEKIYGNIGWKKMNLDRAFAAQIDMFQGVDYLFTDEKGGFRTIQERFREAKYSHYADFTIRYRKESVKNGRKIKSEYYKMKSDYFTYGITNCNRNQIERCNDFIKYVIVDLRRVYDKIDNGLITIEDNGAFVCSVENNRLICPIKYNKDGSSSFFPIEIPALIQLWGDEVIITQKGFLE